MELFQRIFMQAIIDGKIQVAFHNADHTIAEVIDGICYQALAKICAIIQNDRLSDEECFLKIEEIVCVLEEIGADCGTRHDFG